MSIEPGAPKPSINREAKSTPAEGPSAPSEIAGGRALSEARQPYYKLRPSLAKLFDKRPVLGTEDPDQWEVEYRRVALIIDPSSIFEELWIKHFVDRRWEIQRYQLAKAQIIECERPRAL